MFVYPRKLRVPLLTRLRKGIYAWRTRRGLTFLILPLFFILFLQTARGQDLHFSQFFAAPLSTAPSNTGFFKDDWRIGGNFKSQWPWAINNAVFNYRTFAVYADFSFLKNQKRKAWMGAGILFQNDRTGDGRLTTNRAYGSFAYHQAFGIMRKYVLSLGVNMGVVHKAIDYSRLYFNDQWDADNLLFDKSLSSTEPTDKDALLYYDMSVGAHFTYVHNEDHQLSVGGSLFHLLRPQESFPGVRNNLGLRPVVHALAYTRINKRVHLEPGFLFMYQKKAQEYIVSLLAGFRILSESKVKNSIVFLGTAYRPKDAFIPVIGYQYKTIRLLLNYDVNLSTLTAASRADGGLELSLVYTGAVQSKKIRIVPCPRL
ncbi:MAG: hypothetical protein KatS3mg031_1335 [Chitinophagales bacterium]|nr:MAG: hypothetical protein KatS3mg031_1335 [Chitinophagales bacterium]